MITPLNGRIVVRPERIEETASGIIIPSEVVDKDRPEKGTVVVGSEAIPKGSRIVFSMYGFDEVEYEGEDLLLVAEHNVLALLT